MIPARECWQTTATAENKGRMRMRSAADARSSIGGGMASCTKKEQEKISGRVQDCPVVI